MQKTSTHNETTEVDHDVPWSYGYCTLDVIWFSGCMQLLLLLKDSSMH